jgi:carboxylesterase type B
LNGNIGGFHQRLRQPQSLNISWTGTHDATKWGNVCPGVGISSTPNASYAQNYVLNEDCLNINIIRPAGVDAGANLPVLFWIFGGGFTQGTAQDPRYNGSYLVQRSVEQGKPFVRCPTSYTSQ